MGGEMWVESEGVPGKGSAFHFKLRARVAAPLTARPYLHALQPALNSKRVLIVDDNATNRQILALQTQAWGMIPVQTGSPVEALGWIARGDGFDIALLDLQMPEMDGKTLSCEIRRTHDARQLPIIILSSLGQRDPDLDSIDLAAYLTKPVKPSHLYDALGAVFAPGTTEAAAEQKDESEFDAGMGRRHPLSILLAEDNAVNQKVALLILERLGYRADVAGNGVEVLEAVRRQQYDLVLMDVQMPEMDGLEATRAVLAEFGGGQRPRIVAMTANAMKEDRDACLAAGMDDYITKPIQLAELIAALNKCRARVVGGTGPRADEAALPPEAGPSPDVAVKSVQPAPFQAAAPVLDPAALTQLRATLGSQADAMLPVLIASFCKDAPRLIGEARRGCRAAQPADVRRAAHSLKSTSATFGATALSALARELEGKAREEALEGADELLSRIETEYALVQAALEQCAKGAAR